MKRLVSLAVSFSLVLSLVPTPALAEVVDELEVMAPDGVEQTASEEGAEPEAEAETAPEAVVAPAPESEPEPASEPDEPADADPELTAMGINPLQAIEYQVELVEDGAESGNLILYPNKRYSIQGNQWNDETKDFVYHHPSITFNRIDPNNTQGDYLASYVVPCTLASGSSDAYTVLNGLAYQAADGKLWSLPAGSYTITYTIDGTAYTTSRGNELDFYTIDDSLLVQDFYGDDNAFSIQAFGETGSSKLDVVGAADEVQMRLAFRTATAMAGTDAVDLATSPRTRANFYLYRADASKEELARQLQQGETSTWPAQFTWEDSADFNLKSGHETLCWFSGANTNHLPYAELTSDTTGVITIPWAQLNSQQNLEDNNTPLEDGMYWPVLRVTINGDRYCYIYDPIEVSTADVGRVSPSIRASQVPSALLNSPYAAELTPVSGNGSAAGTFSWSVTGSLPAGLKLDATTGKIFGKPTKTGTYTFIVTLTETVDGVPMSVEKELTIKVLDAITLGDVTHDVNTFWLGGEDGSFNVSAPVSVNLTDWDTGMAESKAEVIVVQEAAGGSEVTTTSELAINATEVYGSGVLKANAGKVKRIEVHLSLRDNDGIPVMDADGNPLVLTSVVNDPAIVLGATVTFPAYDFSTSDVSCDEVRLRYWAYDGGGEPDEGVVVNTLSDWQESTFNVEPGTYAFVVEGFVQRVDEEGEPLFEGSTPVGDWIDVTGGSSVADAIEGTSPRQYTFSVGQNENLSIDLTYTAANFDYHTVKVLFEMEDGSRQQDAYRYDVSWYRETSDGTVLVGTGNAVTLVPSDDPLYVRVVPRGSASLDWEPTGLVRGAGRELTVLVHRKPHVTATLHLEMASGLTPRSGSWGTITVKRPLASGYRTSTHWASSATYEAADVTPGTIITFSPASELECGSVSAEVPASTTADLELTLKAPKAKGIVSFGGLSLQRAGEAGDTRVAARTVAFALNESETKLEVTRGAGADATPVKFAVLGANRLRILDDEAKLVAGATYTITVSRRDSELGWSYFDSYGRYAVKKSYEVTLAGGQAQATVPRDTLVSDGAAIVPISNLNRTACRALFYGGDGSLVDECWFGVSADDLLIPFVPAGDYQLYLVDSSALPYQADYTTTAKLLELVGGDGEDSVWVTTGRFTIAENVVTRLDELVAPMGVDEGSVDRAASNVTVTTNFTDYATIRAHIVLPGVSTVEDGSYLELYTNQLPDDFYQGDGYMHPRSMSVNGTPVSLSRWTGLFTVRNNQTQQMRDGWLKINLPTVQQVMGKTGEPAYPMDLTLVVPRTDSTKSEAWLWYVSGSGKRSLVGRYSEQVQEATLTAPATVAWRTFSVYGNAGPRAGVDVYLDGMLAASTRADNYGFYTCEVTLPSDVKDGSEYRLTATAGWNDGKGEDHIVTTPAETVEYTASQAAIEEIYLFYQKDKGQPYNTLKVYDKGALSAKYVSFYRSEQEFDTYDDPNAEHAKYIFMVKLANHAQAENVQIVIPRSDEDLELETTNSQAKAAEWIPDVRTLYYRAKHESVPLIAMATNPLFEEPFVAYATPYGRVQEGNGGQFIFDALVQGQGSTFVTKPVYLSYAPDEVYCIFDDIVTEPDRIRGEHTTPSYEGMDPAVLAECLQRINESSYVRIVAKDNDADGNMVPLTIDEALAQQYINGGATLDEWLAVGTDETAEGYEGGWMKLHHTATTTEASSAEATAAIATARTLATKRNAKSFSDRTVKDAQGRIVLDAFMYPVYQDKTCVYYLKTENAAGTNPQYEMMSQYRLGTTGKYLYVLIRCNKDHYTRIEWDEVAGTKFQIDYDVDAGSRVARASMSQVFEQWGCILDSLQLASEEAASYLGVPFNENIAFDTLYPMDVKGAIKQVLVDQTVSGVLHAGIADPLSGLSSEEYQFMKEHVDRQNCGALWQYGKEQASNGGRNLYGEINGAWGGYRLQQLADITIGVTGSGSVQSGLINLAEFGAGYVTVGKEKYSKRFLDALLLVLDEEEKAKRATGGTVDDSDILNDKELMDALKKRKKQLKEEAERQKAKAKRAKKAKGRRSSGKGHKETVDPSGIVYEAVLSNPVEGARVMLYTYNPAGNTAQFLDSEVFGVEPNPQITGADGRYQWFVPEGFWQVRVSKAGYESFSTGNPETGMNYGIDATRDLDGDGTEDASEWWMPVLPEQLDVNIGLVSYEAPKISKIEPLRDGVVVTFSKYVDVDGVTADLFTVNGAAVSKLEALDADEAADGSGVTLAHRFRLSYPAGTKVVPGKTSVAVDVSAEAAQITSYAGVTLGTKLPYHKVVTAPLVDVSDLELAPIADQGYTGSALKPAVVLKDGSTKLVAGTHYTVAYANNTKPGTATVTITGKGIYGGKRTAEFEVVKGNVRVTTSTKQVLAKSVAKKAQVVVLTSVNKDAGTVTYANAKANSKTKKWAVNAKTGKVTVPKGTKKGTYKVTIRVTAKGNANYLAQSKTYTATVQVVAKYTQPMTVKAANKTAKAATLKKKAVTVARPLTVSKAQGKLSYKKAGGSKQLTINAKTGKVTVKKGTKKGTYTIKIKVTAGGNANYAAGSKTVACKVVVK